MGLPLFLVIVGGRTRKSPHPSRHFVLFDLDGFAKKT